MGSFQWTLWRSFGTAGTETERADAAMLEGCPPQSASGVSRCHPCLEVQTLSGERNNIIVKEGREAGKTTALYIVGAVIFIYLELILQFLFNPLGHMTKSHLPLP